MTERALAHKLAQAAQMGMTMKNEIEDSTEDKPKTTLPDNDDAEGIVRKMTAEERRRSLKSDFAVLPAGHPLKSRADIVLKELDRRGGKGIDDALDAELSEIAIATRRATEALAESNRQESYRITEAFRQTALDRMQRHLLQADPDPAEWDDLRREFEIGHGHYPDSCACVNLRGRPNITGPGSLHFRELANRAVRNISTTKDGWKNWLDILLGYLLMNDPGEEHIRKDSAGTLVRPAGTSYETHPGEFVYGENYEILGVFRVSALCCSWLRRAGWKARGSSGSSDVPIATRETHPGAATLPDVKATNAHPAQTHGDGTAANPLLRAMSRKGLNVPALAVSLHAELERQGISRFKVDRSTIYRIIKGQTKNPTRLLRDALLDILEVSLEAYVEWVSAISSCTARVRKK